MSGSTNMDINTSLTADSCTSYIYSEDVINYLIKYDNDIERITNNLSVDCINIINDFFLVAYKKLSYDSSLTNEYFKYGYSNVPKCYGLMDISAISDIGADTIENLPGLGLTGNGTIIGFIDTGIEYTNPVFRNPNGTTRIKAIWDQNEVALGKGPKIYGYGAEYSEEKINQALVSDSPFEIVPQRDENGHGTFLASVAAGSREPSEPFRGVAPNSDILVVKLKPAKDNLKKLNLINGNIPCYSEEDIMLGIKYLIDKATILGKPLIICLGLGTNQGDHNGNTHLELYINTFVSLRGVCVVSAAGNELGYRNHFLGGIINPEQNSSEPVEISVESDSHGFIMEIWGIAPSLLNISVVSPTGEIFDEIPGFRNGIAQYDFIYEGTSLFILNTFSEQNSGDQVIILRFSNPSQGIWTINVTESLAFLGNGFNAWLPINQFIDGNINFVRSNPNITICSPGNTAGVITAAGYNHYTGALYTYSSRGYTRKGRIKPDITAPAVNIQGVFASSSVTDTVLYTRKSGTSVATALLAGASSLIMEWAIYKNNFPNANTETIKQFIIRGARYEADIDYPNPLWGWGVLDLLNTFENIREIQ
ncbi:MAG: peptidase [Lachnospiraceae bacterium]|nr:peptidase [Lachnospiraceae bacterium]